MEQLTKLARIAETKTPLTDSRSSSNAITFSTEQASRYKAAVTKICTNVMILANRKPEGQELREMVEVWMKTFVEIIPLEKLPPAWKRTLALHKSDFPPTAFSVLKSFHELEAVEQEREIERLERMRDENPVNFCNYKHTHINEHGDVLELIGGLGGKDVVLPCPFCRKDAYTARYAEEKKKYIAENGNEPESLVVDENNVLQMFDRFSKKD